MDTKRCKQLQARKPQRTPVWSQKLQYKVVQVGVVGLNTFMVGVHELHQSFCGLIFHSKLMGFFIFVSHSRRWQHVFRF